MENHSWYNQPIKPQSYLHRQPGFCESSALDHGATKAGMNKLEMYCIPFGERESALKRNLTKLNQHV
ncbi:unnamed protein product [Timema podura]|uniref:Uncharacterized protein n=1 Tax=Timema podura TaxID=61482 RepID=A0ABN7PKI1_TIMPD|nr:unnamed protein product [Timema podura]